MHSVIIYCVGDYGFNSKVKLFETQSEALDAIERLSDEYIDIFRNKNEFKSFRYVSEYLHEIKYTDPMEGDCVLVIRYSEVEN